MSREESKIGQDDFPGIAIALTIIGLWTSFLLFFFTWEISQSHLPQILSQGTLDPS